MRTPVGSSKMVGRSRVHGSPACDPSGVTLTFWAHAADAAARTGSNIACARKCFKGASCQCAAVTAIKTFPKWNRKHESGTPPVVGVPDSIGGPSRTRTFVPLISLRERVAGATATLGAADEDTSLYQRPDVAQGG